MSSLNAVTGETGKLVVDDQFVARTTQWEVNPTLANTAEWGDSDSAGYTNRAAGRKDATFTCEGKFDTGTKVYTLFQPGDVVKATLWMTDTESDALYWHFPRALCTSFTLTVDIDTGDVIGWSAEFGADGQFYRPGEAGAPAETLPA